MKEAFAMYDGYGIEKSSMTQDSFEAHIFDAVSSDFQSEYYDEF